MTRTFSDPPYFQSPKYLPQYLEMLESSAPRPLPFKGRDRVGMGTNLIFSLIVRIHAIKQKNVVQAGILRS
ncbi:MAG: hypothetical protein A2075_21330 [Geobacteraceae bacterium GWC2_58_44]|nr:MAG: hypothetical protein A2075_21330 [Geobacteraceae bacterium GWC2_58_44]HBG04595.1 hypothetical protein [Geobacter sp.]